MLAIDLERNPDDKDRVEQLRLIIQESWMSSVKLDLAPISESLADTLKGLDLLLDWDIYPVRMTEFILILIDRLMIIAQEVEESRIIDMRKTQAILVALQFIILAKDVDQITQGIEDAIVAIDQKTPEHDTSSTDEILLFDDDIELFDEPQPAPSQVRKTMDDSEQLFDIYVPDKIRNPLKQARDFIQNLDRNDSALLMGGVADQVSGHQDSHTRFVLEFALAMNFLAGSPINSESLYKGICLHDIALLPSSDMLDSNEVVDSLNTDTFMLHPIRSAELAKQMSDSAETEWLILHHHEHIDGTGFPYGLKGDNISEHGKLAAIVDSFHNLLERHGDMKPKKRALRALYEININAGKRYDYSWIKLFNKVVRESWQPC